MKRRSHIHLSYPVSSADLQPSLDRFEYASILDSCNSRYTVRDPYRQYDLLAGLGAEEILETGKNAFHKFREFTKPGDDWYFGILSYELKNQLEDLISEHPGLNELPDLLFFRPEIVIAVSNGNTDIYYPGERYSREEILKIISGGKAGREPAVQPLTLQPSMTREEYVCAVRKILEHIHRGDIYEMNYCMEFHSHNRLLDPANLFVRLTGISPMPFAAYFKCRMHYLVCASPERFLARRGRKLISQPIKGTARRGCTGAEDEMIRKRLHNDPKERSENVMIVDLVRNDLSKSATRGSVQVEELFGIYSYQALHQMISTVVCEHREEVGIDKVLSDCFPMGSMTGAPKIRAMEIIEQYETRRRNWYSGAAGYIEPGGNFDFNVIIRSILYEASSGYLSVMAGSAITAASDPELEYEECLLKAESMKSALETPGQTIPV